MVATSRPRPDGIGAPLGDRLMNERAECKRFLARPNVQTWGRSASAPSGAANPCPPRASPPRCVSPRYLWQLRYELLKFGLRPNASGAGAHASMRAQRQREFGDVVAVGGIEDDQEIAIARRQIDLLDLDSHFLGQILSGFGSLGSILDRTDSLVGPIEQTHEHGHAVLRVAAHRYCRPLRKRPSTCGTRSVIATPKKRRGGERAGAPADGTIAARWPERNFGTFRYKRTADRNVTPLPQPKEGGDKKGTLARGMRIHLSHSRKSGSVGSGRTRRVRPSKQVLGPKRSRFQETSDLIPVRCEAFDHRLAVFGQIGKATANGLDGYKHLAPRRQAEKLFRLLGDGFLQFGVIDRKTWAIEDLEFSECVLRMIS